MPAKRPGPVKVPVPGQKKGPTKNQKRQPPKKPWSRAEEIAGRVVDEIGKLNPFD